MKLALIGIIATLSVNLYAREEVRTYTKAGPDSAVVKIETEETDSTQAAAYVDAKENKEFIEQMMTDKESSLYKIKEQIEKENCADEDPQLCGHAELTDFIMTSFGRGGWQEAGAGYTFFMGYRETGTGHFFEALYMIRMAEHTEAQVDSDYNYNGIVMKTMTLGRIMPLDPEQPLHIK